MMIRPWIVSALALVAASEAFGQILPQEKTFDLFVTDSDSNTLVRLSDRSQNGLFQNFVDEYAMIYDGPSSGGPVLDQPASLAFDNRGHVFLADTGNDTILDLIDLNGDGAMTNAGIGEWKIFADNTNASGLVFTSVLKIAFDAGGVLYGVNSGVSANPLDYVFTAKDNNFDGDANDAGELKIIYDNATSSVAINTPFGLAIDPSGNGDIYVSDVNPDGIYRMHDVNADGDFNDAGEVGLVYTGPVGSPVLSNANTLRFHPNGDLFYNDATTDQVVRMRDTNTDGDYNDPGEATVFADVTGNTLNVPKNHFDIEIDENGVVWAVENSTYDAIIKYKDLNNDGDAQDPGEVTKVYDNLIGPGTISLPRALALMPAPQLSVANTTVSIGNSIDFLVKCADSDSYTMFVGIQSLGAPASITPHGYLGFLPIFLYTAFVDVNGEDLPSFTVPPGIPTPLTIYFNTPCGKQPFRYYLSNDVTVTLVP